MHDIIFLIILILNVCTAVYCFRCLKKNIFSFDAILFFMYLVFYFLPIVDYELSLGFFTDDLLRINGYYYDDSTVSKFTIASYLIMVCLIFGYRKLTFKSQNSGLRVEQSYSIKFGNFQVVKLGLIGVLILLLAIDISNYKYGIQHYFSMARKEFETHSNGIAMLLSLLPVIILCLEYVYEVKTFGKVKKRILFYMALSLIISVTTGQRREIINHFLLILFLYIDSKNYRINEKPSEQNVKLFQKRAFRLMLIGAIMVVILIPVTWYLRVYSTQLQYGNIVNPFRRGWVELIFGSSSTGFQTSVILEGFDRKHGIPILNSVWLMVTYFIPRGIFANKAMITTEYVQQVLGTAGNLSTFYINDMWFTFYYFSPVISILFGIFFKNVMRPIKQEKDRVYDVVKKIPAYIALSKIITLFKNGFASYFISMVLFYIIWMLCRMLVTQRIVARETDGNH